MSDEPRTLDRLALEDVVARIKHQQAEVRKFVAEQAVIQAEAQKLGAETAKLYAERAKLDAEAAKLQRDRVARTKSSITAAMLLGALGGVAAFASALLNAHGVVR